MNGSVSDAIGVLAALLLDIPLVVLPGYALAGGSRLLRFPELAPGARWLVAILFGLGLLPVLDSLLVRAVGIPAAVGVNAALAMGGLALALRARGGWRIRGAVLPAALWLGIVLYALIDLDIGGALRQPFLVIDLVKHAATTHAIVETGVPPVDPFFAREGRASYYYFYYTLTALADWLGGPLVDGRTAFAGLLFWTGIGLYGLLDLLLVRSGLVDDAPPALVRRCLLVLLPAGGLGIVLALNVRLHAGSWTPDIGALNEQVAWWTTSLLWVPHHVTAALAAWLGFLALASAPERAGRRPGTDAAALLVAAGAFASCLGLSVWVTLGAVATAGLWLILLVVERRWRAALLLVGAGLLSLAVAAPHLVDLLANRGDSGSAIAVSVRRFGPLESLPLDPSSKPLLRLILLPLNYAIEFGVFAAGAFLFWRRVPAAQALRRETARLLALSAVAALALGSFLRSVIISNDLGWRVVLFAQISAVVWTVAFVVRARAAPDAATPARLPRLLVALAILGYGTTAYGLFWLRAFPVSGDAQTAFINARPDVDHALRAAYRWVGRHLPADAVLQHNPTLPRAFDFGLYGRQPVGVADRAARLFGADAAAVAARLASVEPIFLGSLAPAEIRDRAAAAGIDALVVSAQDPAWSDRASWVWRSRAVYASPLVRVIRVDDL
ncbi:hypothetical protein [Methylobacterium nigriterrae]|uniref:hypothetical protein n=1 Tax=Methylobacterium nigriterrae TaxID=3127512 RepID=UPI0030135A10